MNQAIATQLPVKTSLDLPERLSLLIVLLMAAASLAGLLFPTVVYPSDELRRAFLANDVVNLSIGLPILLGSLWSARRGSLTGLLFWPGALFFATYNYAAYTVAMPFTWQATLFLALVILSVAIISQLLARINAEAVKTRLQGKVFERLSGGVLAGFGLLFFLMAVGKVVSHFNGQTVLPWPEISVQIADLLITPCWVVGGILLWRKQALGYVCGAGLLFQASMLFVGLLVFFILQPIVTSAPFPIDDFVVIFVMGLFCFVPFVLFVRGLWKSQE